MQALCEFTAAGVKDKRPNFGSFASPDTAL